MRLTARLDYACRALFELGLHWPNSTPIQLNDISRNQKIPVKFLTLIMLPLKQAGIVNSLRGKQGGYVLNRAPAKIKLSELYSIFEASNAGSYKGSPVTSALWKEVDAGINKVMDEITLENICQRGRTQNKTIIYQI